MSRNPAGIPNHVSEEQLEFFTSNAFDATCHRPTQAYLFTAMRWFGKCLKASDSNRVGKDGGVTKSLKIKR